MELYKSSTGKYKIETLTASTFPGALDVIRHAFCQDEPVSIGTEVNKNPAAAEELLELCADVALDGVSLVAVETTARQVVAVAFNKIQVQTTDSGERPFFEVFAEKRCKQPSAQSLIKFMLNVDERCNLFEKYDVDCSLEVMFLATLKEHRNQRLGTLLTKHSIEIARKLKEGPVSVFTHDDLGQRYSFMKSREVPKKIPKICQAIWTSNWTQKIGKSVGFKVHLTVPFTEFVYNGKTYAERIGEESLFCEVAAKVL